MSEEATETSQLLDMSLGDIVKMRKEKKKSEGGGSQKATKKQVVPNATKVAATAAATPLFTNKPLTALGGVARIAGLCPNCLKMGHSARNCPQPKQCGVCGKQDHVRAACPVANEPCKLCGKPGHVEIRCTTFKCLSCGATKGHGGQPCPYTAKECHNCKQVGHSKAMCPQTATAIAAAAVGVLKKDTPKPAAGAAAVKACIGCGSVAHERKDCPHKTHQCESCGKLGHFGQLCQKPKKA